MERTLTIPVNKREFFRAFVEILQPFIKVRNREGEVFAELLYQCYLRRGMAEMKDMFKLVFDYDTREKIQTELDISSAVFRNTLSSLRKKKLIINNTIPKHYLMDLEKEVNLTFRFLIQND
tara:strand:+ start:864 stop:1226 length:363 start_codon:yes stop_codon:yes gene_type:complete